MAGGEFSRLPKSAATAMPTVRTQMDIPTFVATIANYGPWTLGIGAVLYLAKLFILKRYRITIDVRPD
jgi:hypothetical protein